MRNNSQLNQSDLIFYLHASAAFQYLSAGVQLGLFELLNIKRSLSQVEISNSIGLRPEATRSLLFGLSTLKLITHDNESYNNCHAIQSLFQNEEWELFVSITKFQADIVYLGETDLVESLRQCRNLGLERIAGSGNTLYQRLSTNTRLQQVFFDYMEAYSSFANRHLFENINLSNVRNVIDVGGGMGKNAIELATRFPEIERITLLDLPAIAEMAESHIREHNLHEKIKVLPFDIFKEPFPSNQDCVLFIHFLVIWSPEENLAMLKKAYNALNTNGQVIIFSSIADDSEDGPLMAALDTAYFRAVAAGNGMIYPWKDYEKALYAVGFHQVDRVSCRTWTPHGIIIGHK